MYHANVKGLLLENGETVEISAGERVDVRKIEEGSVYDPNADIPLANWDKKRGKWVYPHGGSSLPE